jgi:hypothetical protein
MLQGAPNDRDEQLAAMDSQLYWTLSRGCSNAWMLIMASCMEATESYKPVTSMRLGGICAEA